MALCEPDSNNRAVAKRFGLSIIEVVFLRQNVDRLVLAVMQPVALRGAA